MIHYLLFLISYYVAWVLYFMVIQRPLFIYWNRRSAKGPIPAADIRKIFSFGLKTDFIVASYLTALPLLAATVQMFVSTGFMPAFMTVYNIVMALLVGLMVIADTVLYDFWQYKIDSSVLAYLRSLKGAFASVTTGYIVVAFSVVALMAALLYGWLHLACAWTLSAPAVAVRGFLPVILASLLALVMIAACFLNIRGLGRRPNNPSLSFYSKNLFFNHSALNPLYSFIYSLSVNDKIKGAFHAFDDEVCHREFAKLFPPDAEPAVKLLNTDRPNVLFIVWESLCARFIEPLGGQKDVTPNINRLAREGVFFTHVDANSFRTDRGLVALLSGYLAQPTTSVIRMTKKLPNLPALPRAFKNAGYDTMVLHGGDLTIFHKSDYYLTIGHDTIVSDVNFPKDSPRGKWGIHDGIIFDWLYDDIMAKTEKGVKWYTTFQTLSSHETWEVPYDRLLPADPIANSFAYVDDALGRFVDRLKQTPAWKDMLIVVVGDHGCNTGETLERNTYPHIPILMIGGAVREPKVIDTIMSQSDLASTLLGQLGLPREDFIFSRDVLAPTYTYPFSFHTYVNGFMFRDATGYTVVDNVSDTAIECPDPERERKGRVILQYLYEDLAQR